jgi:DNA-binding transcriptional LysR family regulator
VDRLLSMEVLVKAVEGGSLRAAARALGMSAPMAGRHLRTLEARLGTKLLVRTTRRQSLTEVGRQYLATCRQILEELRVAEAGAQAMRATPRGKLRITSATNLGAAVVAPLLPEFLQAQPEIQIELSLSDRVVDLVDEGFDLAIRVGRLVDSSLIARRIRDYGWRICGSPAYLARRGTPRRPRDLTRHELLAFSGWTRRDGWARLGVRGVTPRLVSNHGQALRMAALRGYALILQPAVLLDDDVASGRLVSVLEKHLPSPLPVHLVYPRDRQALPKLTHVVEFLRERLGPPPSGGRD